jgi:hypothetical protein
MEAPIMPFADRFAAETHSRVMSVHDHPMHCAMHAPENKVIFAVSCSTKWAVG